MASRSCQTVARLGAQAEPNKLGDPIWVSRLLRHGGESTPRRRFEHRRGRRSDCYTRLQLRGGGVPGCGPQACSVHGFWRGSGFQALQDDRNSPHRKAMTLRRSTDRPARWPSGDCVACRSRLRRPARCRRRAGGGRVVARACSERAFGVPGERRNEELAGQGVPWI